MGRKLLREVSRNQSYDRFGHLRPYDPRYGPILAKPTIPYDTPKLVELEGEDLFKTLSTIADSGTLIHRGEDGAELYLLNIPGSERALRRALGRRSMEQLTNHVFPKLGTELYLYVEAGDGAGLYYADLPRQNTLQPSSPPKLYTLKAMFSGRGWRGFPAHYLASSPEWRTFLAGGQNTA